MSSYAHILKFCFATVLLSFAPMLRGQNFPTPVSDPRSGLAKWVGLVRGENFFNYFAGSGSVALSYETGFTAAHNFYDDNGYYESADYHFIANYHSNDFPYTVPANAAPIVYNVVLTGDRGYGNLARRYGSDSVEAFSSDIAIFGSIKDLISRSVALPNVSLSGIEDLKTARTKQLVGYAIGMYPWADEGIPSSQPTFKIHSSPQDSEVFFSLDEDFPEMMVTEEFSETTAFLATQGLSGSPLYVQQNGNWELSAVLNSGVSDLVFQTVDEVDYTAGWVGVRAVGADIIEEWFQNIVLSWDSFLNSDSELARGDIELTLDPGLLSFFDAPLSVWLNESSGNSLESGRLSADRLSIEGNTVTISDVFEPGSYYLQVSSVVEGQEVFSSPLRITIPSAPSWTHIMENERDRVLLYSDYTGIWTDKIQGTHESFEFDSGFSKIRLVGDNVYFLEAGLDPKLQRVSINRTDGSVSGYEFVSNADDLASSDQIVVFENNESLFAVNSQSQEMVELIFPTVEPIELVGYSVQEELFFARIFAQIYSFEVDSNLSVMNISRRNTSYDTSIELPGDIGSDQRSVFFEPGFYTEISGPYSSAFGKEIFLKSVGGELIDKVDINTEIGGFWDARLDVERSIVEIYRPSWATSGLSSEAVAIREFDYFPRKGIEPISARYGNDYSNAQGTGVRVLRSYPSGVLGFDADSKQVVFVSNNLLRTVLVDNTENPLLLQGAEGEADRLLYSVWDSLGSDRDYFRINLSVIEENQYSVELNQTIEFENKSDLSDWNDARYLGTTSKGLHVYQSEYFSMDNEYSRVVMTFDTEAGTYFSTAVDADTGDSLMLFLEKDGETQMYSSVDSEIMVGTAVTDNLSEIQFNTIGMSAINGWNAGASSVMRLPIDDWLLVRSDTFDQTGFYNTVDEKIYTFSGEDLYTRAYEVGRISNYQLFRFGVTADGNIQFVFAIRDSSGDAGIFAQSFDVTTREFSALECIYHLGLVESNFIAEVDMSEAELLGSWDFEYALENFEATINPMDRNISFSRLMGNVFGRKGSDKIFSFLEQNSGVGFEGRIENTDFGSSVYSYFPWIYTENYGWIYYADAIFGDQSNSYAWLHLPNFGFVYTSESYFPYVYIDKDETWGYLYSDNPDVVWIYDFSEDKWNSLSPNRGESSSTP